LYLPKIAQALSIGARRVKSKVRTWGNSLAVRIPKVMAAEVGVSEDSSVDLTVEDGTIVIRPAAHYREKLVSLLAHVTPENLHDEVDWGRPRGREAW
jgi:antitoxin MazE